MEKLRLGLIGLGCRCGMLLESVLVNMEDVTITAVCDKYNDRVEKTSCFLTGLNFPAPFMTTDYHEVLGRDIVDAVLIATSWEYHAEIAIAAMKAGIPVASEVSGEYSLRNCFDLVRTHEETGTPYMFLENCCYGKNELFGTALARAGKLGKIVHCSGSYSHDLREEVTMGIENRHYRFDNYKNRCAENYPTHELGPIAKLLNINRGNRLVSLVSVASKAAGLKQYIDDRAATLPDYLLHTEFKQGDIVDTLITCAGGETIALKLDTTLPRFYTRSFTVRGTKGLYEQNTDTVFIEGDQTENSYEPTESYREFFGNASKYNEYLPDMWKHITPEAERSGHGGMDHFEIRAFVDCVKNGTEMPIDVYDAAAWMAVTALSEESIAAGGHPVSIPDFTNGKWLIRKPKDVIDF